MRKNTKRLLGGVIAVAVLGGGYAALLHLPETESEQESTEQVALTDIESGALSQVDVTLRDGESYTLKCETDDSGTTYTMSGDDVSYNENRMQILTDAARSISARLVEENAELSKYGLSSGDQTDEICITDSDGTRYDLRLGLVSETWGTYCTLGDNNTVYVLDEDSAESLTQPQSYYRSLTVLGGYYSLSSELETITIDAMDDGTTVSIERRDTSDLDADVASAYSTFVLTEPIAWAVDDTTLTNGLLSDLQDGLTAQSIVTDAPEDLGDYGLDENAARIHLTANNLDAVVLVGDTTEDDGIYIMQEGSNTVYLSDASAFDFLEEDWNTWRSTALFNCAKAELETVTVRQDDMVYEVQFTKIPADENEEEDEDTITATCNGTELSDEEMEQFCLALISVDYTRLIDEPEAQTTQPEAEVDITMTDGTKHTLAFTKGGSREYLVSVDGAGYAYGVHQAELDNILNALQSE